ncbi:MAG: hypothetical protein WCW64_11180 [Phycisphaerae bacterium]|jgi:hypothetical protein
MKKDVLKIAVVVLFCCGGLLQAVPITIQISGNITSVGGYTAAIPSTIHAGTTFTGTYTYDSSTVASTINGGVGHHIHNAPYGISLSLGGYTFATAPNHVGQFDMWVINDEPANGVNDYYTVRSEYQNTSIPSVGFTTNYIRWDLMDSSHDALSSGDLPVTAPVLTDWNYNVLTIGGAYGPNRTGLSIHGTITQVIPEPLTSLLMMTGVFLLRRRR